MLLILGDRPTSSLNKTSSLSLFSQTTETQQPCLGAFNTESSQEEASANEGAGGGSIGDLVAHLLLGGGSSGQQNSLSSSSSTSSPSLPPCPPSAPLRDSSGACVQNPPVACSSAQPRCASCDPAWQGPEGFASCLRCEDGYFAFSSEGGGGDGAFGASTAGARSCLQCSSLRCGRGGCVDGRGCAACPEGLRLERRCASCPLGCV